MKGLPNDNKQQFMNDVTFYMQVLAAGYVVALFGIVVILALNRIQERRTEPVRPWQVERDHRGRRLKERV
jgi:hypothetical protein